MRYYTTKSMNGGTTFKCTFCEHNVTTLDFNSTNGNRRRQHVALLHSRASGTFWHTKGIVLVKREARSGHM
jgi:hypothetical protein